MCRFVPLCVHVHTHMFLEGWRNLGFTDTYTQVGSPRNSVWNPRPTPHGFPFALGNQPGVPGPPEFCAFKEFGGGVGEEVPCLVSGCHV